MPSAVVSVRPSAVALKAGEGYGLARSDLGASEPDLAILAMPNCREHVGTAGEASDVSGGQDVETLGTCTEELTGAFGLPGPEPFNRLHVPVLKGKYLGREGRGMQRV